MHDNVFCNSGPSWRQFRWCPFAYGRAGTSRTCRLSAAPTLLITLSFFPTRLAFRLRGTVMSVTPFTTGRSRSTSRPMTAIFTFIVHFCGCGINPAYDNRYQAVKDTTRLVSDFIY